jgi:PTH1 family peptidyl-tRNA hydrolase
MDFGFRGLENPKSEIPNPKSVYLVLGLGNPGSEYDGTFHNVGFRVLERMAGELRIRFKESFAGARISERTVLGDQKAVLALPQTFMNRSGSVVPRLLERFETTIQNTVVVCDDLALPIGKLRVRQKGSAGGHNGLKSIISACGSDEFMRVRVGIQPERDIGDVRDFVLSRVGKADREVLDRAEESAARAVESLLANGIEKTMAAFNGIDLRQKL